MNVYFIGMCVTLVIFAVIALVVSKKVQSAEDFYVAGRRAPLILIAGSMIASYTSTGMFMGDAAQCYEGVLGPIVLFAGMQSAGYIIGAVFFGRYLRRSNTLTIPEFFGKRFDSSKMRALAAITAIVTMTVYLLSVVQGVGTLMNVVTGLNYNVCIVIALLAFAFIAITSGSKGVLITDTLMACVFTLALIVGAIFIAQSQGGWFDAINTLASNPSTNDLLSGEGRPGPLYNTGWENIVWGLNFGIVWFSVCMVGPWQSSRYMMAKNESVVIRSSFIAAIGVFVLEFVSGMAAVIVNVAQPELASSSHVLLWAAMNLMPKIVGIVLLTGVLCAGISSATTFLSLIGASFANDVLKKEGKSSINTSRWIMAAIGIVVCLIAVLNPPAIFWIMFLGGAIVSASWMPVALGSVFSKRLTKQGAFWGMLIGFLGCFGVKLFVNFAGISLPAYLDPSIIGMVCNIITMIIVSARTQVTPAEEQARKELFVIPAMERNPIAMAKTLALTKRSVLVGIVVMIIILAYWVVPYLAFSV